MGRWLGIDFGSRRIGLALGDPRGRIASPAGMLHASGNASRDADAILARAAELHADGLVLGLPLNMNGSEGPQARRTRDLADRLRERGPLPVELWDERLSTFQADALLDASGVRPSRRRERRDQLAALVILQSFLDARREPDAAGPGAARPDAEDPDAAGAGPD